MPVDEDEKTQERTQTFKISSRQSPTLGTTCRSHFGKTGRRVVMCHAKWFLPVDRANVFFNNQGNIMMFAWTPSMVKEETQAQQWNILAKEGFKSATTDARSATEQGCDCALKEKQ